MITIHTLTLEWITQVSSANKADKILVEKVIRAMLLLEGLVESGMPFVFKGGTALMLHLNSARRLSIDIDIMLAERQDLEKITNEIVQVKGFTKVQLQHRHTSYNIEKVHYKFYYIPVYRTARNEEYILLDVLIESPKYASIIKMPIQSAFLHQDREILQVSVASMNDLLGDKLTAFAPFTTGIPYQKSGKLMTMEIIKQLYDIGCLFEQTNDLSIINKTFRAFAMTELGYRQMEKDVRIVLRDIYQTSLLICTRGLEGTGDFNAILTGIHQVKQHIFSESYSIEKAIIDASKAAYLAKLIEMNATAIEKFNNAFEIKDWIIEQPFNTKFNKFKKTNPEAFFYWHRIYQLTLVEAGSTIN